MSTNISRQKRNEMKEFLTDLKEKLSDDESIIKLNEIENALLDKKFGLIWEKHSEEVDLDLETKIPVFREVMDNEIKANEEKEYNFLLEGDNLHSLYLLEKTHSNRIDIIYIDPPYNTRNSLTYNDNKVGDDDSYRHSKWLSFMNRRLNLAKNLLSDKGFIAISIDDTEQAQLKLLCDEIFGEQNFIGMFPRQTKRSGKSTMSFSKNHDYILLYVKKAQDIFKMQEYTDPEFKHIDEHYEKRGKYKLNQTLDYSSLGYVNSLDFPIRLNGETFYPGKVTEKEHLKRKEENPKDGFRWRWGQELVKFGIENDWLVINENTKRIYTKTYENATIKRDKGEYYIEYVKNTKPYSSLEFTENKYSNDRAKRDLDKFKLKEKFDYPKPVELIKTLIGSHKNKNAIVLDFFAGSGTTAEAVIELNNQDGGNRKFILCTNNENGICENITLPRLRKVINGYEYKGTKETVLYEKKFNQSHLRNMSKQWEKIDKIREENRTKFDRIRTTFADGIYYVFGVNEYDGKTEGSEFNLKHYKTDYLLRYADENDDVFISDELMLYIKEMVQLENHIKIDNKKFIILHDDDDLNEIFKSKEKIRSLKKIYKPSFVFLSKDQVKKLNECGVKVTTIPDYYFAEELRGAGEL